MMWEFITNQMLKMTWLNDIAKLIVENLPVDMSTKLAESMQYFIFDVIKIFLLLSTLIFVISYIQSYFSTNRTKQILSKCNGIVANIMSALLGTITPFCSCSSIPLFIAFTQSGIKNGITFSFLISSPMVDLGALVLLVSIFGIKVALLYVLMGLVLAVVGGVIIDKLQMQDQIKISIPKSENVIDEVKLTTKDRLLFAKEQVSFTVKKVYLYVFFGVFIGALIHNWIPQSVIKNVLGNGLFAVPLATAVGIPMYADIFGIIPIAEALHYKGIQMGTILSFMMSTTAISLPSIIMLSNVIKPKLLSVFVLIVTFGIVLTGYLFNLILN